jgi:hypothetical protein
MKVCFKCKKEKTLTEYYKHSAMSDGHLNKCKDCTKLDVKNREEVLKDDPNYIYKERKRGRDKYYRLNYRGKYNPTPEKKKEIMERYKDKYPEKIKAQSKSSKLKTKVKGNHLHHWSYNEEHFKDVIELTVVDHNRIHRYTIYDQERKMYRTTDGVLLDTKEQCLVYYKHVLNLPF